ncbi:hypothetical protein [Mycobacterium lepromatosis]|uniref:hypothetical protein n=1 Tax=Mycobacterium lepromatosis TaxID=480418 RepID=UPI000A5F076E|nr:hypothetical protein [Mycobacterium lepromatosis]
MGGETNSSTLLVSRNQVAAADAWGWLQQFADVAFGLRLLGNCHAQCDTEQLGC